MHKIIIPQPDMTDVNHVTQMVYIFNFGLQFVNYPQARGLLP